MDITTLSKSELIELLYAVTEKAKKKGGKKGIQTPPALPLEDNSSKPLKGKHWSQWKSPRLAENQMKRRKELFEATEKAKKKGVQSPDDVGYAQYPVRDGETKYHAGKGKTAARSDFPQKNPSYGQKTPRVMPGSRVDINKQNRDAAANQKKATLNKRSDFHKMKVNEAKMKRRKELDSSSVTEKGRRGSHREGGGGPKITGNEPRPTRTYSRAAINYPEGPGSKYSAPQGPDKKNRSMKRSWEWESPMGKMRGKELQTEQAIDQYLSYESEMDDNRQLMFEVITEKARKPGQKSPQDFKRDNDVKPGGRWSPPDERPRIAGFDNSAVDAKRIPRMKKEEQDSDKRIQREGGFRARNVSYDHLRNPIIKDNYRAGSRQERPYSPENVGDQRRNAKVRQEAAKTRMQVNVGKARQKRKLGFPAIVPTRRNKELFEVITEKAKRKGIQTPPVRKPRKANVYQTTVARDSQASAQSHNQNEAKQARREQDASQEKARSGAKDNRAGYKKETLDYFAKKTADYEANAKREREASQAQTQRLASPQNTRERRKEQQFDGSLVVGAESFFLQMVAATKPK